MGDDNPENHMIVESFPVVMVSCHQDANIRFWDMKVNIIILMDMGEVRQLARSSDGCIAHYSRC